MSNQSEIIIQELNRIASKSGGVLKPELVVESARSPLSPLHDKFTWDDTQAAHEFRLQEARKLIRVTVHMLPNGRGEEERVWVSLKHDQAQEGGGYRTLVSVLSDADLRKQLLQQSLKDMQYFSEKYSHLEELSEIFSAMKKVRVKMMN